ncbi:hypothetical protein TDB9533_00364 [Thalassocella blandensis]|nr:hypothetical protein TDB9533_00364 [Thalassocella blandensis]
MSPSFIEGDYVMCYRLPWMHLKIDDVVVLQHPNYPLMIKRICEINQHGHLKITGENSLSSQFDFWFSPSRVVGKVLFHFKGQSR